MRAVTSLERRRHPDTTCATRRIVESPARSAERGVVQIERIDVDGEHRDAALFALRNRPVALQQFLQIGQREQPGQPVVADRHRGRLVRAAQGIARELGVDAQPLARIAMMAGEVRDTALGIEQRQNRHLVPKQRAVLAVISQQHAAGLPAVHRLAQPVPAVLLAIVPLQQPQIAADEFSSGIAGQRFETGIGVDDRAFGILRIDEHHSFGRSLDQAAIQVQRQCPS